MSGTLLVSEDREVRRVSDEAFLDALRRMPARMASRLAFMTPDHHAVRNFVVRDMPRHRRPLSPQEIATGTGLGWRKVSELLSELEERLFFLLRNSDGCVSWAFPVTTTVTRHKLTFSSGEPFWVLERKTHLLRPSCKDAYEIKSCGFVSIQNAITAHSPWPCMWMSNCAGVSFQEAPRRCYSSRR
ncbi:MAG: hypothetical protein JO108_36720 [Acidobacteriaceae bacterium]|nr:hypothetical protein [Acidobacteriaceae bacterium]